MADTNKDNIYLNLKGLIWSAFIGVVSFQLLAPNIWNYLHKQLAIPRDCAYNGFVIFYLLLIPVLATLWLVKDFNLLRKHLIPFDQLHTNKLCTVYLRSTLAYCILLILFALLLLYMPLNKLGRWFIWAGIFSLLFCTVSLIIGTIISYKKIQNFNRHHSEFYLSKQEPTNWKVKAIRKKLRWVFIQMLFVCFLVVILFSLIYGFSLDKESTNQDLDAKSGQGNLRAGFALIRLNDKLSTIQENLTSTTYDLKKNILIDSAQRIQDYLLNNSDTNNPLNIKYVRIDTLSKYDSLLSGLKTENKPDNIFAREAKNLAENLHLGPSQIDTASTRERMNKFQAISEIAQLYLADLQKKNDRLAKTHLGIRLRNDQITGTFILMNLFLVLLSLYTFLRINALVHALELELLQYRIKASELDAHSNEHKKQNEIQLDQMQSRVSESDNLAMNSWFHLTLTAWLLIPFFKPVEDGKIDTDAPYKGLTASNQAYNILPSSEHRTESTRRDILWDSIVLVPIDTTSRPGGGWVSLYARLEKIESLITTSDEGKLSGQLRDISKQLDTIETSLKDAQAKLRRIEP